MEKNDRVVNITVLNEITRYIDLGHKSIKQGRIHDSIKWYYKALNKAKESQNRIKEKEIKRYLITLL